MPKIRRRRIKILSAIAGVFGWLMSNGLGVVFTIGVFLALPLLQQIAGGKSEEKATTAAAVVDAPQDIEIEEEKPPEDEPEPEPEPEIESNDEPLSLADLTMSMNAGPGNGGGASIGKSLSDAISKNAASLLSGGGAEQLPRPVSQSPPRYPSELQRKGITGIVKIELTVDANGRVRNPQIVSATDPRFKQAALAAVRQWRYEPGLRGGAPAPFKIRVPLKFG